MQAYRMMESTNIINNKAVHTKHPYSVLIVDDDPIYCHMLSSFLVQNNYHVELASDGLEGLLKLRNFVPDLILCDLSMPVMEGMDFVEEVSWQFPHLPLIVISATQNMSDVAKVLRFGIKDFLTKPLTQYDHLITAIETSIHESNLHQMRSRDFSSQWFGVNECQIAQEKELYWHIEQLKQDPVAARDLLHALQPDKKTSQGAWHIDYLSLQPSDSLPLIFDYAWIADGRFIFYLLDSSSNQEDGIASALLVRALFNDFLRHDTNHYADVSDLAKLLEQGLECTKCNGAVHALFGIADMTKQTLCILPAGLGAQWKPNTSQQGIQQTIAPDTALGLSCHQNKAIDHLPMNQGGDLIVTHIGARSFRLNFKISKLE